MRLAIDSGPFVKREFGITFHVSLFTVKHRIKNLPVAGTSADVAADGYLGVLQVGVGTLLQELSPGHDHAGDAEAALHGGVRYVRLLQRVEGVRLRPRQPRK